MMPYYFEVPEITLPFDVLKYLDQGDLMQGDSQIVDTMLTMLIV